MTTTERIWCEDCQERLDLSNEAYEEVPGYENLYRHTDPRHCISSLRSALDQLRDDVTDMIREELQDHRRDEH